LNEEVYVFPSFFPTPASEAENRIIWLKVGSDWPMFALISNIIPDLLPQGGSQCFPFYTYAEDGSNQRENITDWALAQFQAQYGAQVTKRDIFHYVYGVLHSPQYREHYADNLKRELPRIPLTPALSHGEREPDSDLPWPLHGAREPDSDLPSPCGRGAGGEGNEPQPQKPPLPPALLQRCRELRQASTGAEQILWQLLRDRQFVGAKFRRQHPLRGYILDFYCHEARLAIELDGGGHADPAQAAHDAERTRALQAEGISVLRFWNNQVSQNTEGVLEEIWAALNSAHSPPLSHPENEPDSDLPAPGGRGAGGEGGFWHFVDTGARLADIHLNYEQAKEYKLKWIENKNVPFSWRVTKMQLSKDKTQLRVNESLTLTGIPAECFEYRLGNRSALDWVIDQYQISTDKRSGITSDPNRDDDEEYIVRLVGRVITVSMETVKLVKALPPVVVVEVGVP